MFTKTISYEVICNPGGINSQYLISPLSPEWFSVLWKLVQVQSCRDEAFTQIHYRLSVSLESEKNNNKKQLFEQTPKLRKVKLGLILEPFLSFNFQTNTCACHIHYPPLEILEAPLKHLQRTVKLNFSHLQPLLYLQSDGGVGMSHM